MPTKSFLYALEFSPLVATIKRGDKIPDLGEGSRGIL